MGVSYSASTIMGVKFNLSDFSRQEYVGKPDYPRDWDFDPVTGEELWNTIEGQEAVESILSDSKAFGSGIEIESVQDEDEDFVIIGYILGYSRRDKPVNKSTLAFEDFDSTSRNLTTRLNAGGIKVEHKDIHLYTVGKLSY